MVTTLFEFNFSDLISIIIAIIALYIAFKKNEYDEHREKNNLKFIMIDRCNNMIQNLFRNYELINQIENIETRQELYELNEKAYKNAKNIYQLITNMKDTFDLKTYDSTLKTILDIEMKQLYQQKKIVDNLNKKNPQE